MLQLYNKAHISTHDYFFDLKNSDNVICIILMDDIDLKILLMTYNSDNCYEQAGRSANSNIQNSS